MNDLPKCDAEDCPGHLGKFSDCVTEGVYQWSLEGCADDGQTGSVDYQGHYSLFIVTHDQEVWLDDTGDRKVAVPAGNYILHSASSGAVSLWKYETADEARIEFDAAYDAYAAWEDQESESEDYPEVVYRVYAAAHGCSPAAVSDHDANLDKVADLLRDLGMI